MGSVRMRRSPYFPLLVHTGFVLLVVVAFTAYGVSKLGGEFIHTATYENFLKSCVVGWRVLVGFTYGRRWIGSLGPRT